MPAPDISDLLVDRVITLAPWSPGSRTDQGRWLATIRVTVEWSHLPGVLGSHNAIPPEPYIEAYGSTPQIALDRLLGRIGQLVLDAGRS